MSGETRKLQKVSGGTYTVSIPKEWATEQSLSAGETVHIYPDGDGSLIICRNAANSQPAAAMVSLRIDEHDSPLARVLSAAYVAGVDQLRIKTPDGFGGDDLHSVERLVRERTGMRVTEATEEAIEVRTILDDEQVSIERTVVQLQFVALSLFRTAVNGALDGTAIDNERVATRRDDASQLLALVTRQFNRSLSRPKPAGDLAIDRPRAFALYRTAHALQGVASAAADIAEAAENCEQVQMAQNDFRSVADDTRLFLEDAISAVVDPGTVDGIQDCYRTFDDVGTAISNLLATPDDDQDESCVHARNLFAALRRCHYRGEEITDVAYQVALRK